MAHFHGYIFTSRSIREEDHVASTNFIFMFIIYTIFFPFWPTKIKRQNKIAVC